MGVLDRLLGRTGPGHLGSDEEPVTVDILDRPLRCQVCRHDYFWRHVAQVHTPGATFFNLEFANRLATCVICARCGFMRWFMPSATPPAP